MQDRDITQVIKNAGVHKWELAEELQISESSFSKWFRHKLTQEREATVMSALNRVIARKKRESTEEDHSSVESIDINDNVDAPTNEETA
ncbi:MAG: hypothetical protein K5877_00540 [Lachnospiraceae bacterium]|nr:hypothetical protein [Lachnospiraceae bacterium]